MRILLTSETAVTLHSVTDTTLRRRPIPVPGCAALAADLCRSGSLELARLCFFVRLPNPRDAQTAWRMSTGGIITGLPTYANISAGIGQNQAEEPSLMVQTVHIALTRPRERRHLHAAIPVELVPVQHGQHRSQHPEGLHQRHYLQQYVESTRQLPAAVNHIAVCLCGLQSASARGAHDSSVTHVYLGTQANDVADGNAVCVCVSCHVTMRQCHAIICRAVCAACSTCTMGQYISAPCSNVGGVGVSHDLQCTCEKERASGALTAITRSFASVITTVLRRRLLQRRRPRHTNSTMWPSVDRHCLQWHRLQRHSYLSVSARY